MKLLFYISTIKAGGAARVMTNLASMLAEDSQMSNEIYLLTNFRNNIEYQLSDRVIRYSIDSEEKQENRVIKNIRRCLKLRKLIKEICPEIVISFMTENDMRSYLATRRLHVKTVMSVRNDPNVLFKKKSMKIVFRYIYNCADGVVFQTEDAKNWFGYRFRPYNKIIMNQTANKFYKVMRSRNPYGIVTLGSFLPKKNHMLLIRAFSFIADAITDDLWIYGEGMMKEKYDKLIQQLGLERRVHIQDFTDKPEEILSRAKIFVLSSDYEGMPNVLLEALASGVACISTDCPCGGPRMVINDGENGILTPVGDAEALADAMKELIFNKEKRDMMEEKGRESAERFAPNKIYNEWKDFFTDVMEVS